MKQDSTSSKSTYSGMVKQLNGSGAGSGAGAGEACTEADRATTATETRVMNFMLIE